jgi:hypothetical protein
MNKIIKKYFTHNRPKPLINIPHQKKNDISFKLVSFGHKNKNKYFYIIKRDKGSGFFSNFYFILSHLKIALKFNFIPFIDMKNFKTIYNENSGILKNKNAWEYYFKQVSNYKAKDIYKSNNVFISGNLLPRNTNFLWDSDIFLKKVFKKYIRIKDNYIKKSHAFVKKNLKQKTLGVHFRGTSYKTAKNHSFQPNVKIMINLLEKLLIKYNYKKIFIITEEKKYLDAVVKKFKEKVLYYNSYRSDKDDAFKIYPRKNHRFNLGKETIIETLIMSKCDGILSTTTNVEKAANILSKKKQLIHYIFLGTTSRNKYIAKFLWYAKSFLPPFLGGLKILRSKNC